MDDNHNNLNDNILVYKNIVGNDFTYSMWIEDGTRLIDNDTLYFIQYIGREMVIMNLGLFSQVKERTQNHGNDSLIFDQDNNEIGHLYDREITRCLFILRNTNQDMRIPMAPPGYVRVFGICCGLWNGLFVDERQVEDDEVIFLRQPNGFMMRLGTFYSLKERSDLNIVDINRRDHGRVIESPISENLFVKRQILPEIPIDHPLILSDNGIYNPLSLTSISAKSLSKALNRELAEGNLTDERLNELQAIQDLEPYKKEMNKPNCISRRLGGKGKSRRCKKSKKFRKSRRKVRRIISLSN